MSEKSASHMTLLLDKYLMLGTSSTSQNLVTRASREFMAKLHALRVVVPWACTLPETIHTAFLVILNQYCWVWSGSRLTDYKTIQFQWERQSRKDCKNRDPPKRHSGKYLNRDDQLFVQEVFPQSEKLPRSSSQPWNAYFLIWLP